MSKRTMVAVTLLFGICSGAKAQEVKLFGNYVEGSYAIADQSLRFFAFAYSGDLNDSRKIWAQARMVCAHLDAKNITHEWKDGNGNFNEVRLGQDRVFVIGAYNPLSKNKDLAWMATVPGKGTVVVTSDQGNFNNTGWLRRTWMSNGHKVNLQFGDYRGAVQWCVGHDR